MRSALGVMIDHSRRIRAFLKDPRDATTLMPWTLDGLHRANNFSRKRFAALERVRKVALGELRENNSGLEAIDRQLGYHIFRPDGFPLLSHAIAHCQHVFTREKILATCSNKSKADTLLSIQVDLNDSANAAVKALALSPRILAPIGEYLGDLPALIGSYVWYSPNRDREGLLGSQLFHYDREDILQIKCFIPLDIIDHDTGPFTLIAAKDSKRFLAEWSAQGGSLSVKQRFGDADIKRVLGENAVREMTGGVGDIMMVDTTNCLHYGSRPGQRGKYHITLHYISAFSRKLFKANLAGARQHRSDVESLVMQYYGRDV